MNKLFAFATLLFTSCLPSFAQQFITNHYNESRMNCHRLMWDTYTDSFGRLWFANNEGVVKFDGNHWTVYPTPNPVRSIMVNAKGQIFVTCINDFGVLDNQSTGYYQYTSFRKQANLDKEQISGDEKVILVGDQVFYVFKNKLVKISAQSEKFTATVIPTETSLGGFALKQSLYLNIAKMGLCLVSGSNYKMVENGSLLIGKRIVATAQIGDKQIIATAFDGLYLLHQNRLINLQGNIQSFASNGIVDMVSIGQNLIAVGSLHDGVQLFRVDGNYLNKENLLPIPSNEIYHLHTDAEGNLWVAHAKGLSHYLVNIPLKLYDNMSMNGNITRIKEIENQVYIATSDGLYQVNSSMPTRVSKLINGECWDIIYYNNRIWVASTNGLYQLENGIAKLIVTNEIFVKLQLGNRSKSLFAFGVNGCYKVDDTPRKISGIDELANAVFETQDGSLWFGTDYNGLRITNDKNLGIEIPEDLKTGKVVIRMILNKPVFQTKSNAYTFDENTFLPNQHFKNLLVGSVSKDFECDNEFILFTDKAFRLIKGDSLVQSSLLHTISGRPTAVCKIGNGFWTGFEDKLYIAHHEFIPASIPITFISSVTNSKLGNIYFSNSVNSKKDINESQTVIPEIDFQANNLRLYLGINSFVNPELHAYRYQINQSEWSEWKHETFIDLNALASGKYAITIQAKNAYNQIGNPVTFTCYVKPPWYLSSYAYLLYICLLVVLIYVFIHLNNRRLTSLNNELEEKVKERTTELIDEKKKSDDLLHNILPEEVALELKKKGFAEAKLYNHVTVLFTDFVGFTTISEQLSPTELVREIHENFTAFDAIIDKHGLEKIKTIGDAYLAVCGLPHQTKDHAERVLKAAIDIRNYMAINDGKFQVRIGIHSGPVVAGIVGVKKYAYDIWGDTVNTAARMEQNSEAGKINISGVTHELTKQHFNFEYRGKIKAKNKGEVDMYFVGS